MTDDEKVLGVRTRGNMVYAYVDGRSKLIGKFRDDGDAVRYAEQVKATGKIS